MSDLRTLPTLDELAADPAKAADLPVDIVEVLLARCHILQGSLFTRLLAAQANDHAKAPEEDRLLAATEAAKRMGTTEDWLYRHARELPFTVKNGRLVRFSSKGIERYIRERQGA